MTQPNTTQFPYPRRQKLRTGLRWLARRALHGLADFEVIGRENLPQEGPFIVVANHFHFADTAALIAATDWPLEFLGGFHFVDAPFYLKWIPDVWGYYAVRRGAVSRTAMHASRAVLAQNGFLAIFPEAGSWADVLRPARPGTAFVATQTSAPLLPVGLDGVIDIFPALRRGRRAKVTVRIGRPFGPFSVEGKGRARRPQLEAIGDEIMRHIAALIPPERHGVYSEDPALRAAAQKVADYPFHDLYKTGARARFR